MSLKHILIIATLLAGGPLNAAVYHVDGDFQGDASSGTTWRSAFPNVQDAIDAASTNGGGEVWIKNGIYKPRDTGREASFELKPGIRLYGGFLGGETEREERNPKAYRTVLSGDIDKIGSAKNNCFHVITGASNTGRRAASRWGNRLFRCQLHV